MKNFKQRRAAAHRRHMLGRRILRQIPIEAAKLDPASLWPTPDPATVEASEMKFGIRVFPDAARMR